MGLGLRSIFHVEGVPLRRDIGFADVELTIGMMLVDRRRRHHHPGTVLLQERRRGSVGRGRVWPYFLRSRLIDHCFTWWFWSDYYR